MYLVWWLCIFSGGEDQGQWHSKQIGISTNEFYISGLNLVMLAWMCDKVGCGKLRVDTWTYTWMHPHTDGQTYTDAANINTWSPKLASDKKIIRMEHKLIQHIHNWMGLVIFHRMTDARRLNKQLGCLTHWAIRGNGIELIMIAPCPTWFTDWLLTDMAWLHL